MADRVELARLRAEAIKLRRQAMRKEVRQAASHNMDVETLRESKYSTNTNKNFGKLNASQLSKRIAEYQGFLSRKYQVFGDAYGRPLNPKYTREYLEVAAKVVRKTRRRGAEFASIKAYLEKNNSMTVLDVQNMLRPPSGLSNTVVPDLMHPHMRRITNFASEKAMRRRTESAKKVLDRGYWKSEIAARREQQSDMLRESSITGASVADILDKAHLSDKQYELLVRDRRFFDAVKSIYEHYKDNGGKGEANETIIGGNLEDIKMQIAWAKTHFVPIKSGPNKGKIRP